MKCQDIAAPNTERLSSKDTIAQAAKAMAETGLGFLPICDANGKAIGVLTDRDIVIQAMARGLDPDTTSAAMIMTAPALTCRADADLTLAEELMANERKARIVLTKDDGTLAGVLSIADIIERAPKRQALKTLKAVLWREALGPRAGADADQPLLQNDAPPQLPDADLPHTHGSVFAGGHRDNGIKEFP